jgi:hypothetical protein
MELSASHHANILNTEIPLQVYAINAARSSKGASPAIRLGATYALRTTSSTRSFQMRRGLLGNVYLHHALMGTA